MLINGLKEIKNFLEENSESYMSLEGGFKHKKTLKKYWFEKPPFEAMHKGEKCIKLSEKDMEHIREIIPEDFSDYIYYKTHFYFVNFDLKELILKEKKDISPNVKVFDFEKHNRYSNLSLTARAALDLLVNAFDEYVDAVTYKESNYVIEKEVETPNEHFDYSYSLSNEESDKMRKWEDKHFKKYHKPGYKGAIGVSDFELRFRSTSIGTYAECVCTGCEKEYLKMKDIIDPKKAEKMKDEFSFDVRGLE